MKLDLGVMYLIQRILGIIKTEMDKRDLSFDEFLEYWDAEIERLEKVRV